MEALFFRLDSQAYAIALNEISEILNMATLRTTAEAPSFVAGFLNLRGRLLPVVDLSQRLDYPRPEPPPSISEEESPLTSYRDDTRLLMITLEDKKVLMIIDGLEGILNIADQNHQDAEDSGMESMRIMDDSSTVQLIKTSRILSANELEELLPLC